MTVREMLARIDSAEISEWIAYEAVTGPLGPERADIHAALIAQTVANTNRGKGRPRKLSDFLLKWDQPQQTWQDQLALVHQINRTLGGEDQRGRDSQPPGASGGGQLRS